MCICVCLLIVFVVVVVVVVDVVVVVVVVEGLFSHTLYYFNHPVEHGIMYDERWLCGHTGTKDKLSLLRFSLTIRLRVYLTRDFHLPL